MDALMMASMSSRHHYIATCDHGQARTLWRSNKKSKTRPWSIQVGRASRINDGDREKRAKVVKLRDVGGMGFVGNLVGQDWLDGDQR